MAKTSVERQEILTQLQENRRHKANLTAPDVDIVEDLQGQHRQEVKQENARLWTKLEELRQRDGDPS